MAVQNAKQKLLKKELICKQITLLHDSIELYNNIIDLLWCLTITNCSIFNVKCELVLQCIDILDNMLDDIDIAYTQVSILFFCLNYYNPTFVYTYTY